MKLYNSLGPNPRLVRMFLAEKGMEIPLEELNLVKAQNRQAPYTDKNPGGQLPALELDDGKVIAETVPICEYLEEQRPSPALIGATPVERAETRMWTRRVEQNITENLAAGFRYAEGLPIFKDRMHVIPQAAADFKAIAQERLAWLDGLIAGRDYIAGKRFTLADVVLFSFLDFGRGIGQTVPGSLKNVTAWFERVGKRPSAEKSLHPMAARAKMNG